MDFNFKIKIIGYYTGETQNMHVEKRLPKEAGELASLLERTFDQSFSSTDITQLKDQKFVDSLKSNTVFIFKDEDKNLYAYFPVKKIARLSGVVYDRKKVGHIPAEYKSWFYPGEKIPFVIQKKKKHKSHCPRIVLCNINGDDMEFSSDDFNISTVGSDFLIHLKRRTYALNWEENSYISIRELDKLIKHKWTYLDETNTDDECGNCDGYEYDCDWSRCKHDCQHCGGRRYICNDGCFFHRYDTCISIKCDDDTITEDLSEGTDLINKIITPHSQHKKLVLNNAGYLRELYDECLYIDKYLSDCVPISSFIKLYNHFMELESDRNDSTTHIINVKIINNGTICKFKIHDKTVKAEKCGFLWLKRRIILDGYDFMSDKYVKQKYIFKLAEKTNEELFHKLERGFCSINSLIINIEDGKAKISDAN